MKSARAAINRGVGLGEEAFQYQSQQGQLHDAAQGGDQQFSFHTEREAEGEHRQQQHQTGCQTNVEGAEPDQFHVVSCSLP